MLCTRVGDLLLPGSRQDRAGASHSCCDTCRIAPLRAVRDGGVGWWVGTGPPLDSVPLRSALGSALHVVSARLSWATCTSQRPLLGLIQGEGTC